MDKRTQAALRHLLRVGAFGRRPAPERHSLLLAYLEAANSGRSTKIGGRRGRDWDADDADTSSATRPAIATPARRYTIEVTEKTTAAGFQAIVRAHAEDRICVSLSRGTIARFCEIALNAPADDRALWRAVVRLDVVLDLPPKAAVGAICAIARAFPSLRTLVLQYGRESSANEQPSVAGVAARVAKECNGSLQHVCIFPAGNYANVPFYMNYGDVAKICSLVSGHVAVLAGGEMRLDHSDVGAFPVFRAGAVWVSTIAGGPRVSEFTKAAFAGNTHTVTLHGFACPQASFISRLPGAFLPDLVRDVWECKRGVLHAVYELDPNASLSWAGRGHVLCQVAGGRAYTAVFSVPGAYTHLGRDVDALLMPVSAPIRHASAGKDRYLAYAPTLVGRQVTDEDYIEYQNMIRSMYGVGQAQFGAPMSPVDACVSRILLEDGDGPLTAAVRAFSPPDSLIAWAETYDACTLPTPVDPRIRLPAASNITRALAAVPRIIPALFALVSPTGEVPADWWTRFAPVVDALCARGPSSTIGTTLLREAVVAKIIETGAIPVVTPFPEIASALIDANGGIYPENAMAGGLVDPDPAIEYTLRPTPIIRQYLSGEHKHTLTYDCPRWTLVCANNEELRLPETLATESGIIANLCTLAPDTSRRVELRKWSKRALELAFDVVDPHTRDPTTFLEAADAINYLALPRERLLFVYEGYHHRAVTVSRWTRPDFVGGFLAWDAAH